MSEPRDDIPDERADTELEQLLRGQRPVPGGAFRGGLGRLVAASDPGYGPRPARLRLVVTGWIGAGIVVAGLGALQALGAL